MIRRILQSRKPAVMPPARFVRGPTPVRVWGGGASNTRTALDPGLRPAQQPAGRSTSLPTAARSGRITVRRFCSVSHRGGSKNGLSE
jgi:hypothetical protein